MGRLKIKQSLGRTTCVYRLKETRGRFERARDVRSAVEMSSFRGKSTTSRYKIEYYLFSALPGTMSGSCPWQPKMELLHIPKPSSV
ncbi:hypothetical protein EPI10_033232 [Gossypium australe]|uniref:Uncharacterized protein n=1 Tax=Gossypium australe TaxID=47621 RepID=A0A5B6X7T3_9ROSI|nr:hypothetical protein EPI10_033232 [Gossypium australe]